MSPVTPIVPGHDLPVTTFAKDQPGYNPLPAFRAEGREGAVITRWRLSDEERKFIADGGDIWLTQLTFNNPLQPVKLTAECPVVVGDVPGGLYERGDPIEIVKEWDATL